MSRAGGGKERGRLAGRFERLEHIGEGAMADVWLAKDHGREPFAPDRRVALKVLRGFVAEDRAALARFKLEGTAMSGFRHPNIARVFAAMRDDDTHFLVMEHISGGSLAQALTGRNAPIPAEDAVEIVRQVCAGLGYAHARGIIHRDIKPANVMLDGGYEQGRELHVKVTDFGIARAREGTRITRTGGVVGTPAYMPAEVMKGETATVSSDVYGCGAMLYQLLTATFPFSDGTPFSHETPAELIERQEAGRPAPPATLNPAVREALSEATLAALALEPQARYPSVDALSSAVAAAWRGEDWRGWLPKQRTWVTMFMPATRRGAPPPPYQGMRPWLSLVLFAATLGVLAILFQIFVRLGTAVASLPISAIAAPVVLVLLALGLARSPLFASDPVTRENARRRLRDTSRSTGRGIVVGVLAAYWALLGYHLADTVRSAIERQPQDAHLWLEIGGIGVWAAVAVFPLKWLLRSRMPVSRLLVAGVVVALGWTAGAEVLPQAPGTVGPLIWGNPSLREKVRMEGKRWTAVINRTGPRVDGARKAGMRTRVKYSRDAVLRALRYADTRGARRRARRWARRWLRSMRRARIAWVAQAAG